MNIPTIHLSVSKNSVITAHREPVEFTPHFQLYIARILFNIIFTLHQGLLRGSGQSGFLTKI